MSEDTAGGANSSLLLGRLLVVRFLLESFWAADSCSRGCHCRSSEIAVCSHALVPAVQEVYLADSLMLE